MDNTNVHSHKTISSIVGTGQAYSDGMIRMLLTLKSVYRPPLRALQGFATSLQRLAMPDLAVYERMHRTRAAWQRCQRRPHGSGGPDKIDVHLEMG